VSYSLIAFAIVAIALLLALFWLSWSGLRRAPKPNGGLRHERDWRHISYLPQIKQALANADYEFLEARGSRELAKRVAKERQRIALHYLRALRTDFEKLVHFARVVAAMSPEVAVVQEMRGFRLHLKFSVRYYAIYLRLLTGIAPLEAIGNLSDMLSALTLRMERAIGELGERAALNAELSSYNRGGMDGG
jgi:hypothetical protein